MEERDAIIEKLIEQVNILTVRVKELEKENQFLREEIARLKKNSGNSSMSPSSDIVKPTSRPSPKNPKRKQGAQRGHKKHSRREFTPEQIDNTIEYELKGGQARGLIPMDQWDIVHQVTLPEKLYTVTEHRGRKYWGTKTGRIVSSLPREVTEGCENSMTINSLLTGFTARLANLGLTVESKRNMLEKQPNKAAPTIKRQCELLDLSSSTAYYQSHVDLERKAYELKLLNLIDELYTEQPTRGRYGITDALAEQCSIVVNHKRVRRLMAKLGIEAVYPKPRKNTSQARKEHLKYPYLLSNVEITHPDQLWCTDITYIRIDGGFVYLVAVMDWYSRCVLSWELSNTMDSSFCVEALQRALSTGRRPEIFNTDQGSQFTSEEFTSLLRAHGIAISMDGVGRAFDNIMVERLWRTVKYEDVYIRDYKTPIGARFSLNRYFDYYNNRRRHSSLGRKTPASVYNLDKGEDNDRMKQTIDIM